MKIAANGADRENIKRCRRIRLRSIPSLIKNETKPNAAGALRKNTLSKLSVSRKRSRQTLCNIIAMKTIISTLNLPLADAAPKIISSRSTFEQDNNYLERFRQQPREQQDPMLQSTWLLISTSLLDQKHL